MPNADYESRIDDLVRSWKDDVYWGVLEDDVLPAVQIYAHASLDGMTATYDASTIFPMFSNQMELHDHYGSALFSRLSAACTSIRNGLKSIQAHMDCHAAIAASRRAHESLWQMFWLCNPEVDKNARVKRLVSVTEQEIAEALRFWGTGINDEIRRELLDYRYNIRKITDRPRYVPKLGWQEYHACFDALSNGPSQMGQSSLVDIDQAALAWSMMSNMTHPNVVFDWIIQMQDDEQDTMDRLQLFLTIDAMAMVANLSTLMMAEANLPEDHVVRVNATVRQCLSNAESLLELQRR